MIAMTSRIVEWEDSTTPPPPPRQQQQPPGPPSQAEQGPVQWQYHPGMMIHGGLTAQDKAARAAGQQAK
eukprot:6885076-Prorocentrum_lima.AAC.1